MTLSPRVVRLSSAACLLVCLALAYGHLRLVDSGEQISEGKLPTTGDTSIKDTTRANDLIRRQPGFFVPNLGQWDHAASFVHRSGPMTLFLEDRGWVIDLVERPAESKPGPHEPGHHAIPGDGEPDQKIRGTALRMTFEGNGHVPDIVGEKKLPGHHNYFLGNDESRWRTGVPLYGSVRYENLYPGIDLRLRQVNGVPEYDLLLQPGAELSLVTVHVEGGQGMSIASDGSLVIETALGPVTQSVPKTWQVDNLGRKREVVCSFTLLGTDRFGFAAPGWDDDTSLTIDPGLLWSTFLGGVSWESVNALFVDASGVVTVAGATASINFPTTSGAYDTTYNGYTFSGGDAFVSRLDPRRIGTAQLVYSTFLGGTATHPDGAGALSVDASGVVTVAGVTWSKDFPTTRGAFDTTFNGGGTFGGDIFLSRLDPRRKGTAQLLYSTYLGGDEADNLGDFVVDSRGAVTLVGQTWSTDFPTTKGAYDTTRNGNVNAFISRLDPNGSGAAQLIYSTYLGGSGTDGASSLSIHASGVVTVGGFTVSSDFPTTKGAYDTTHNGSARAATDAFVSRILLLPIGSRGLVYSTFLGGSSYDYAIAISVDGSGVITVAGSVYSSDFPTTPGAYDRTKNARVSGDAFAARLDPRKTGTAQLLYSTYLGGSDGANCVALSVDASGVLTMTGSVESRDFPTTSGAFGTIYNGGPSDVFLSRLDPRRKGTAQLVYSTYLGGIGQEVGVGLAVNPSGVVTVVGGTSSPDFPTTRGGYRTTLASTEGFVSRLDMGVALYGDVHEISIKAGGTQKLTVNAGKTHANRSYWIFGSETGTTPGINLLGLHIPLNPDLYTIIAMGAVNGREFTKFRGTLDANGLATASFNSPANLPFGFTFHHAYVVYDASGKLYMASNAVPLTLR